MAAAASRLAVAAGTLIGYHSSGASPQLEQAARVVTSSHRSRSTVEKSPTMRLVKFM